MRARASKFAAVLLAFTVTGAIAACGGSTSDGDGTGAGGSSSGAGGRGSGGAQGGGAQGGGAQGGAGTAGSASGGSSGGSSGAAGGGGGSADLDLCQENSDCVLTAIGCCAPCPEQAALGDFIALNVDKVAEYTESRGCDVACGACPEPDPTKNNGPYLIASCQVGHCVALDIREQGVTSCDSADDCQLRAGSRCCASCNFEPSVVVAISDEALLQGLTCAQEPPVCPECAPQPPANLGPDCDNGQCVVRSAL